MDQKDVLGILKSMMENLAVVEEKIKQDGITNSQKSWLLHEKGTLHGMLGQCDQQKAAWLQALQLDPANTMVRQSLEGLLE